MSPPAPFSAAPFPGVNVARYATWTLWGALLFAQMDIVLTSLLLEPIKRDLLLSDAQLGLIQGTAFAIGNGIGAVPMGMLIDRCRRVWLLRLAIAGFVAAMLAAAAASGFAALFLVELALGLVLALVNPAAASLIADFVAAERRGRATSILALGQVAGQALAFFVGGALIAALDGGLGQRLGLPPVAAWRIAYIGFAALGLIVLPFVVALREPVRQEVAARRATFGTTIAELRACRGVLVPLFAASALGLAFSTSMLAWAPALMMRCYGLAPGRVGNLLGLVMLAGGVIASIATGRLTGAALRSGGNMLRPAAVASLVAAPCGLIAFLPDPISFALVLLVIAAATLLTQISASIALLTVMPNELRGIAFGLYLLVGMGIGRGIAPGLVAWLGESGVGLGTALAIIGVPASALAAPLFLRAGANARRAAGMVGPYPAATIPSADG